MTGARLVHLAAYAMRTTRLAKTRPYTLVSGGYVRYATEPDNAV